MRHKGTLEFDADGNAVSGTPGEWIVHYTYDALGRLIRRQLPHNLELEQVRIEEFYFDGVRRISETLTTPLFSSGGGPVGGGGGTSSQTYTDREYVWAPPPSGYVDECVCQIDRNNAVRYVVQDASYDVVALVAPQTQSVASKVIGQYTWDPYGQVLTAEYSGLAATYNKLGHHGLFADRLDAGYTSPTLMAGFVSSTHLPARIVYQVRNRTYDPSVQRWLQRDPNATGQVVLGSLASGGEKMSTATPDAAITSLFSDAMSLYDYCTRKPVGTQDRLGLFIGLLGPTSLGEFQADEMQRSLETGASLKDFISNWLQEAVDYQDLDADWASDWSAPDDWFNGSDGAEDDSAIESFRPAGSDSFAMAGGWSRAIEKGMKKHKKFSELFKGMGDAWRLNKAIPGTRLRPDALNKDLGIIYELKPANDRAAALGARQLEKYIEAAEAEWGRKCIGILVPY